MVKKIYLEEIGEPNCDKLEGGQLINIGRGKYEWDRTSRNGIEHASITTIV